MPMANQVRKGALAGDGLTGSLDAVGVAVGGAAAVVVVAVGVFAIGVVDVGVAGGAGGGFKVWSSGGSMEQG